MIKEIKRWGKYIGILIVVIFIVVIIDKYCNNISSNLNIHTAKLEQVRKLKLEANEKLNAVKLNLYYINEAKNDYPTNNSEEEVLMLLDAVKKIAINNSMTLIAVNPQLNEIEGDDYLVRVKTIVEMVGTYSNLVKTLNQLGTVSKASSISEAEIKFTNQDSLRVKLVITSLVRPKLEATELNPIIDTFNNNITDAESVLPFGVFVDSEAERKAALEKISGQNEDETNIFEANTNEKDVNEKKQNIYIEDVPDDMIGVLKEDSKNNAEETNKTIKNIGVYPFKTKYPVSSNWGWREDLMSKEKEFHYGVDIAAPQNTNVYALKAGEVQFVGQSDSYGKIVIIRYYDGLVSLYGHLNSYTVTKGEKVNKDTIVGVVGSSEHSSESILHVGLVVNEIFVNPNDYIEFN